MDNQFHFGRLKENLVRMRRELPVILANQAQNFFVSSFTKQGWDDKGWKEVKRRIEGTNEWKYPKFKGLTRRTKPILIGTGRLRRAVSNSIRSQTFNSVRLVVDLPYAAAQNEGDPENNLPRRHYMGNSPKLVEQQRAKIKTYINKAWQA